MNCALKIEGFVPSFVNWPFQLIKIKKTPFHLLCSLWLLNVWLYIPRVIFILNGFERSWPLSQFAFCSSVLRFLICRNKANIISSVSDSFILVMAGNEDNDYSESIVILCSRRDGSAGSAFSSEDMSLFQWQSSASPSLMNPGKASDTLNWSTADILFCGFADTQKFPSRSTDMWAEPKPFEKRNFLAFAYPSRMH